MIENFLKHRLGHTILYKLMLSGSFFLLILVRPSKNQFCFSSWPDYTDNCYYLFLHLAQTRDDIHIVWLVQNIDSKDQILKEFEELEAKHEYISNSISIFKRKSFKGFLAFLRSKYIFHTHGLYSFSRNAFGRKVINLWHGMPIKSIGKMNKKNPNPSPPYQTGAIASSIFFRYVIACSFDLSPDRVQLCRQPRCDRLVENTLTVESKLALRLKLGIDSEKRMVLWLPTHRDSKKQNSQGAQLPSSFLGSLGALTLSEINSLCSKIDIFIIIKLHPNDQLNNEPILSNFTNIRLITSGAWIANGFQLYDVLGEFNALISDVSSVIFDFLYFRRPIGIIGYDDREYTRDLNFPIDYIFRSKYIFEIQGVSELEYFLLSICDNRTLDTNEDSTDFSFVFNNSFEEKGAEAILRELKV